MYIARVADDEGRLGEDSIGNEYHHIAEAVEWAMSKRVHIISISWGMKRDIPVICRPIKEAISRNILIFACASNAGANYNITFPARLPRVFCIGSADGLGTQSDFSPPFPGEEKFSALGEAVLGARSGTDGEIRKDGTSISTPIAAGLAALLIQYTRQFTPKGHGADTYDNMRKLFFAISKSTEGKDYRYLAIGVLFETGDPEARIKRILNSPLDLDKHWLKGLPWLSDPEMIAEMGDVANRAGKYIQAMSFYQRALETIDRDGEPVDPSRKIHVLDMLGQVCYFQGLYDESLASHHCALDIVYSVYGDKSTWCMEIFPRISGTYLAQGQYEEAISWSKKVLHDFSTTEYPTFRAYASRLIGDAYLEVRETEAASGYLDYALSTYLDHMPERNNPYTARTMALLGKLRYLKNEVGAAETYFKDAAEMVLTRYGRDNINSVWSLEMYAGFLVDTERPDEAIESLQGILKLYRDEIGSGNLRSTFALHALGRAYAKRGQHEESIAQYLEALEILEQHYGSNYTPEAAAIMRNLGYSYVRSGRAIKAKEMLKIAASIYENRLGEGHILHKETEKELASIIS